MKTVYHIGSGAQQFPYDVDADNAVRHHPAEWSLTPWPVDKTNEWRQKDYDRRVDAAKVAGAPPPAEPPELSLSPEAQAEIDQDAKSREEAQKIVDEADKRETEAREWTGKVAAARATLAAAPVQPSQLATGPDVAVSDDKNTDIPPNWQDMNNARRRGLAQRLGAPRDIKQDAVNSYIEGEVSRRANSTQAHVQTAQDGRQVVVEPAMPGSHARPLDTQDPTPPVAQPDK